MSALNLTLALSRVSTKIQELDQQRARGQQGAKSPLLWEAREVEQYLAGSPVQADIRARLQVRTPYCNAFSEGDPHLDQASDFQLTCWAVQQHIVPLDRESSVHCCTPGRPLCCGPLHEYTMEDRSFDRQCLSGNQGIEKEYGELDTVWFMAGSLFGNYPYDTPTDAFPLKLFREVCWWLVNHVQVLLRSSPPRNVHAAACGISLATSLWATRQGSS